VAQASSTSTAPYAFRQVRKIARGGMGEVHLVLRSDGGEFRRLYAVKRLHPGFRDDDRLRAMFVDEARIAGLLRHANVVNVIDVGEDGDGPYILMDYVDGVSVAAILEWSAKADKLLPVQLCARIAGQAADGLHAAHELASHDGTPLGLVHRDVSPQNILVGFDGVVRVSDFGIAKAFGRATHTTTGVLKGKIGYMAPEVLRFEDPDRRSDLFSLGVVLYEMLSGARLYGSERAAEVARRILNEPQPDIGEVRGDVPVALVELVIELLAKDPADRPSDARTVARRLEVIAAELVMLEQPIKIEDFLERAFAEARTEQRREVTRALEVVATELESEGAVAGTLERLIHEVTTGAPSEEHGRGRPRARWIALAAAVAIVCGLAVAGWGFGWPAREPSTPAAARRAPAAQQTSAAPRTVPPAAPPQEVVATPAAQPSSAVAPPARAEPRTRARRTRPRPPHEASRSARGTKAASGRDWWAWE